MTDWARRLKQFVGYLQRERRVGSSAQHQYRSIVKDWIEFSLARGHDPTVFDQVLVDTLLDHRAHRNSKGTLTVGSRLSYASNLKVFCEWAFAERPRVSSQRSQLGVVASSSAPPGWRQEQRSAPSAPMRRPTAPNVRTKDVRNGGDRMESPTQRTSKSATPPSVQPPSSQIWIESWQGPLPAPIDALEQLLQQGGTTIVRAAFQ